MDEKLKNQSVQTYVEDMTKVLKDNKEGIIKKLIHEQEKKDAEKKSISPETQKNRIFMSISVVLLLLGLGALFYFFYSKKEITTTDIALEFKSIIFVDKTSFLEIGDMKKDEIADGIAGAVRASDIKLGQAEGIYLTENKKVIGLRRFISLIKSSFAPREDIYVNDVFLMGATNKGEKDLFVLLKVRSFRDVFPLMRTWEEKMFFDLHGLFAVELNEDTKYLLTKEFEDGLIQNKNARVLYDNEKNIIMMYLFADDNSIILANNEATISEIMLRIVAGEIKK